MEHNKDLKGFKLARCPVCNAAPAMRGKAGFVWIGCPKGCSIVTRSTIKQAAMIWNDGSKRKKKTSA